MKLRRIAGLLLAFLVLAPHVRAAETEYVIGKHDVLSIHVWGEEALSGQAVVRPDGKISLPGIGSVQAEGLTPTGLQRNITGRLTELVFEPRVSVMVQTFRSNSVVVHGPGVKSATVGLEGRVTLLQLLAQVSPDAGADLQNAYLERGGKSVASDFSGLFLRGDTAADMEVKAGDRIFIPLRANRFVYVEGAVAKPATLPHYEGMTVVEAIHLAGGFTKFADRNDTSVLRKGASGPEVLLLRLNDFTEEGDFAQNIAVQGGDIIVVRKGWF